MVKTMGWLSRVLALATMGVLLLNAPAASAQRRVVVVRPAPFWGWGPGPYWGPYYPYGYPSDYISEHFGYVKIDTHHHDQDASVFVDEGFAAKAKDAKKFALRPGNHEIELRDNLGRSLFKENIAVFVGKTTKVDVPS
jgi:hypothetical protein